MIYTPVLSRVFNCHDIFAVFNHAKQGTITLWAATDHTEFLIRDGMARSTKADVGPQSIQGFGKGSCLVFIFFHEMQHQAQGGLLPDTRQLGYLVDRVLNKFRWVFQRSVVFPDQRALCRQYAIRIADNASR